MRRASFLLFLTALVLHPQTRPAGAKADPQQDGMLGKLTGGHKFIGGIAWSRDGFVLFSDTPSGKIMRVGPEGATTFREGLAGPMGLAVDDQGRVYVCESRARRVIRLDPKGTRIEVIADNWQGKKLNGPNDVVVEKSGHIYFSDPAFASADLNRELDFYGIYHVPGKGETMLAARVNGRPNGLAVSPDGQTLYVANSDRRAVLAFDVAKNGALGNERVFVPAVPGVPDGLRIDRAGNLWVAAKESLLYSRTGKQLRAVQTGEKPGVLVLGESDAQTLFIGARTSVYRLRLQGEAQNQ